MEEGVAEQKGCRRYYRYRGVMDRYYVYAMFSGLRECGLESASGRVAFVAV
jgi:hypothetical protein